MTRAANLAEAAGSGFAFRRKNLNGSMDIWQRGTSFTGGSTYTADRWRYQRYASSNVAVSQQSSGRADFPNCLRIGRTNGDTGGNAYWVTQALEAVDSRPFRGNKATLSFYARIGSGYQGQTLTGSSGAVASISFHSGSVEEYLVYNNFITQTTTITNLNFVPTTSWQQFTVTSDVLPTGLFQIGVAFGVGSVTGTAGTNDYIEITGVQLEVGAISTSFEFRPYGAELALCQRYFELTSPIGIQAASNTGIGNIVFSVPKRSSPTYFVRGSGIRWYRPGIFDINSTNAITINNASNNGVYFSQGVSGATSGTVSIVSDNTLEVSAEL